MTPAAVLIVREPDGADRIRSFGPVTALDVDLGQADLRDRDEASDWLAFHQARLLAAADECTREVLWAYRNEVWRALELFGWSTHPRTGECLRCGHTSRPVDATCHWCHGGTVAQAQACLQCPRCICCDEEPR